MGTCQRLQSTFRFVCIVSSIRLKYKHIYICSDSQAALKASSSKQPLEPIYQHYRVNMVWVLAHADNE